MEMDIKIFIYSLTLFSLILDEFVPTNSLAYDEKNSLATMVISRIKQAIEKSLTTVDQGQNIADLYFSVIKCIMDTENMICNVDNTYLKNCLAPAEKNLDESGGAKYAGYAKLLISAILSGKDFICSAKVMEIVEIFNPCLYSDLRPLLKCWENTLTKLVNPDGLTNIKEEYCKALEDNKQCSLEELTSNCQNLSTKYVMTDIYDAFFSQPCAE